MIKGIEVNKFYGANQILNNCNFSIELDKITTIIGKSGCGKTTLLKCLHGIEQINSGKITIEYDNKRFCQSEIEYSKHFGLVLQGGYLWRRKTVLENIILAPQILNQDSKKNVVERAKELLYKLNLISKENSYPNQLSGGEKQRVAIARTLILNPKVLLLDEITFSLDPINKLNILELILKLKDEGYSLVLVSHDIAFSKKISEKIIYMENGGIVEFLMKENFNNKETPAGKFLNLGV